MFQTTNQIIRVTAWPSTSDVSSTNYGQCGRRGGCKLNPPTACFANHARSFKSQVGFHRTNPESDTDAGLCWLTLNLVHKSCTSI